ncbi:ABC transporter permease [Albimonas pacifica]|uniref:Peptide/nickel transport system permease protein n=1 Tax=Albimonas pacifica TaxID=1114924 RepID=A0A1I3DEK2_9RHOB|nr:ABC transporter permease [Albimonas pacifica]SFH85083.1 peptide/nickel transport system permease protein [Albimonas pacifica]
MTDAAYVATEAETEALPPRRRGRLWQALKKDRKAQVGLAVLAVFVIGMAFASLISPYDPNEMTLEMMSGPSWIHPLGTDDLGRDLLSRILHGTRVSLLIGVSTVLIALVLGVALGMAAGWYGGWLDLVIMRYIDLQWAFPNFIIAVYLVAVFGTGLVNVIVAVSLAFLDDFARIARSMTLTIREEQFVDAARTMGFSDARILVRHILPSAMAPIIVQATVSVSYAILGEATLSFLGLGVEATTPTWGLILADGRGFVSQAWWLGVFPGLAIMLVVLAINFIGDWLRDALDVRQSL